jgi:hypothetical protein
MKKLLLFPVLFFTAMFSYGQWSYTDLTEAKFRIGVTSLDSKAYFAGGESESGQASAVEIYDVELDDWDTVIHLLAPRSHIAAVASGKKVFFAGGIDFQTFEFFDIVEIWNTETRQWEYEELTMPKFAVSAVSYGNKVLFAGGVNFILGQCFDLVEIYDTETGSWSYDTLSMARNCTGGVAGDLAFFAGGSDFQQNITNRVDIYNFTTQTWSIDSLSQARMDITATSVGNKVLFAGGTTALNESSDRVDIYDTQTGTWSIACLSQPRAFWEGNSGTVCNEKAYFVGGGIWDLNTSLYSDPFNTIDIYNSADSTWTTDTTIAPILGHAVIGVGDHLLIAGGMTDLGSISTVQMNTCLYCPVEPGKKVDSRQLEVKSYPNPFSEFTTLEYVLEHSATVNLSIFNHLGQQIAVLINGVQPAGRQLVQWNTEGLPAGIYHYQLSIDNYQLATGKLLMAR